MGVGAPARAGQLSLPPPRRTAAPAPSRPPPSVVASPEAAAAAAPAAPAVEAAAAAKAASVGRTAVQSHAPSSPKGLGTRCAPEGGRVGVTSRYSRGGQSSMWGGRGGRDGGVSPTTAPQRHSQRRRRRRPLRRPPRWLPSRGCCGSHVEEGEASTKCSRPLGGLAGIAILQECVPQSRVPRALRSPNRRCATLKHRNRDNGRARGWRGRQIRWVKPTARACMSGPLPDFGGMGKSQ